MKPGICIEACASCPARRDDETVNERFEVIRPADLRQHQLVGLAPKDRARRRIDDALRAENVEPDCIVETPNSSTVRALALAGAGIGFVSPFTVHGFVERGLVVRPFEPRASFRYYLLFSRTPRKPVW